MAIFGYRQLGLFFSPFVEIHAKGFVFKGKQYAWGDVKKVELREGSRMPIWGEQTGALIWLRDGAVIDIKAPAFTKEGEPLMDGYSSAFDELIATFKANTIRQ